MGKYERGEGYVNFAQALILCGTRSVCLSLWRVDDVATALLMERFYQNHLGKREGLSKPMGKAAALAEAKVWLRTMPHTEVFKRAASLIEGVSRGKNAPRLPPLQVPAAAETKPDDCPFAHPRYWAAFISYRSRRLNLVPVSQRVSFQPESDSRIRPHEESSCEEHLRERLCSAVPNRQRVIAFAGRIFVALHFRQAILKPSHHHRYFSFEPEVHRCHV